MRTVVKKIINWIQTPRNHRSIILAMMLWVVGFFVFSIWLYNQTIPFSMNSVWISNLGNPDLAVKSVTVFNIGIFCSLFFFMAHFLYLFHELPFKHNWFKRWIMLLLYAGAIGFCAISIFTDNIQPIHDIMAGFAFGGLGLGYLFLDFRIMFWGKQIYLSDDQADDQEDSINNPGRKWGQTIIFITFCASLFLIIAVGVFIAGGINYKENSDWIILWEWLAFFALGLNILTVAIFTEKIGSFLKINE
jgi:hypothetical protein